MTAPAPSGFISYSRRNVAFAERLHFDLERCGLTIWRDRLGIPSHSPGWWEAIRTGIATHADFLLLLASPETGASDIVHKELAEASALGNPVHRILVGGSLSQLPETWRVAQITDFQNDYWENLRRLLIALKAPKAEVSSVFDLITRPTITVEAAATELNGAPHYNVAGRLFYGLPVEPSGYTMTWLVGPADAELCLPNELAILFRFSGQQSRDTPRAVLEFWATQPKFTPWMVWVDGPVNAEKREYELDGNHVWADGIHAAVRAVERFGKGRRVGLFFDCPVALGFAVGGILREMFPSRLYNWQRGETNQNAYQLVYERNPH
ncbi:MAG TPA: toll/interleukin-1 receptor domain-containing protein [Gemmata sp.]|jgi:hypothetical protein|nr:toll/interleukin-1 receptor domain-containing protein [Gemmata sp.]